MNESGASNSPHGHRFLDAAEKEALRLGLELPYDHMYASNTEEPGANADAILAAPPNESNCTNAESEVRFLREWLLLHLDLIQHQNDELLAKDKTILFLRQENEMLKERLGCHEKTFPTLKNNHRSYEAEEEEDMTQESSHVDEESESKEDVYVGDFLAAPDSNGEPASPQTQEAEPELAPPPTPERKESPPPPPPEKPPIVLIKQEVDVDVENEFNSKFNDSVNESVNNSSFVVDSSLEDTLKNLRMSIKRKRVGSTSSAVSLNDNSTDDSRKKKKRWLKDTKIMTCDDQYINQVGEIDVVERERICDVPSANNLEVPRWRVKVYTSCYTMEGTENLDDDVFNKRHLRLETDERRRKRWDVQRIREQRMIEKLKQRQERVGSGSKGEESTEPVESLWPLVEDIKYLEVTDQLPVSAFGCPMPRLAPSDFSLPWINNPHILAKRTANRKTSRRKMSKR